MNNEALLASMGREPYCIVKPANLYYWISPAVENGIVANLRDFHAAIEKVVDTRTRLVLRDELRRLNLLCLRLTSPRPRFGPSASSSLPAQVETAGGKTGLFVPLD